MTSGTAKIIETPPLREGDRLRAEEFHRRYEAMPELRNAHLIDGVVHMSSPIRADQHGEPHALVIGWLHDYRRKLRGIRLTDNTTFRIDADNEPQPDAVMFLDPTRAGSAWIEDDGYLHGVPELIVEIAGSSSRLDGSLKRELYDRIGVAEYLVWHTVARRVEWLGQEDGVFQEMPADEEGVIKSAIFPGLWLHVSSLLEGDIPLLTSHLEAGLASAEHQEFARRLNP